MRQHLGVAVPGSHPGSQEAESGGSEFDTSLDYTVRPCLRKRGADHVLKQTTKFWGQKTSQRRQAERETSGLRTQVPSSSTCNSPHLRAGEGTLRLTKPLPLTTLTCGYVPVQWCTPTDLKFPQLFPSDHGSMSRRTV